MEDFDQYWRVWLRHWHDLCDPNGPEWKDEDDAAGMIAGLWNDRQRLNACLSLLPRAAAVTTRINEILDAALGEGGERTSLYFVVKKPYPAGDDELFAWTRMFYQRCRELTGRPETVPRIQIVRCEKPGDGDASDHFPPELHLADRLGDYISAHCTIEERAASVLLTEPLYRLACDYRLVYYVDWLFVDDKVEGPDPCRAQFDLWRSHAHASYRRGRPVRVFAPLRL